MTNFSDLLGLKFSKVIAEVGGAEAQFFCDDGRIFNQYHFQDCCEFVRIDEIHGDLDDLIGTPITLAEEVVYNNEPNADGEAGGPEDYRWTFYKLATVRGYVTIKWLGESNGYYSTSVSFYEVAA